MSSQLTSDSKVNELCREIKKLGCCKILGVHNEMDKEKIKSNNK